MSVDHVIMAVISTRPCSGYDLKIEFEHESRALVWSVSYAAMYKRLQVLEQQGFVETYEVENGERKKKMYELTAVGWDELKKWMAQPTDYPIVKDELLLKLGAWGKASPDDISPLLDHLHTRKIQSQHLLHIYEEWSSNGVSSIDGYDMLGIEYLIARLRAELKWIDFAVSRLEAAPLSPVQDPFGLIPQQRVRRETAIGEASTNGQKDK